MGKQINAVEAKPGTTILVEGEACIVKSNDISRPGKHGHAKCRIEAKGIIDGKKVRTLDKSPESLRSMDYLNQAMVSQIDFYNYEDKVNEWAKTLGEEKILTGIDLGGIERKGIIKTKEDITSREDILPGQKKGSHRPRQ